MSPQLLLYAMTLKKSVCKVFLTREKETQSNDQRNAVGGSDPHTPLKEFREKLERRGAPRRKCA